MKLFHHPASPNARRAGIAAEQAGLPVELQTVDVTQGEQRSEWFRQLNPNEKIPTLVDGDFVLWESQAIMQYLAAQKPEAGLLPADERGRADVARWQHWTTAHFGPACGTFGWENLLKPMLGQGEPDRDALESAHADLDRYAGVLEGHLAGRDWLVGHQLTIADLSVACALTYRRAAGIPVKRYSTLMRWFGKIEALDAWQRTLPPIGND